MRLEAGLSRRISIQFRSHNMPRYRIGQVACQVIPGSGLDEIVSRLVLEAVSPASLEIALEVFEELRARRVEIHRLHRVQVQPARRWNWRSASSCMSDRKTAW